MEDLTARLRGWVLRAVVSRGAGWEALCCTTAGGSEQWASQIVGATVEGLTRRCDIVHSGHHTCTCDTLTSSIIRCAFISDLAGHPNQRKCPLSDPQTQLPTRCHLRPFCFRYSSQETPAEVSSDEKLPAPKTYSLAPTFTLKSTVIDTLRKLLD